MGQMVATEAVRPGIYGASLREGKIDRYHLLMAVNLESLDFCDGAVGN